MPIANHPKQTCEIWLDVDMDRPEAERPTFICRFLTRVETLSVPAKIREIGGTNDAELSHKMLDDLLMLGIVGWHHMNDREGKAVPFSREAFDQVLTEKEKFELVGKMVTVPAITEADRKKSSSPSPSESGSSATVAREDDATTSLPQASLSI